MFDILNKLYRTKLLLICVLLTIGGLSLMILGNQLADRTDWLSLLPFSEFGGILIGAGFLSVSLDAYLKREQAAIDDRRLRSILHDQAPIMRDAVLDAFAADHEDLARVSTPETLDRIITNSLALRLGDQRFATEIYKDIHDQAIEATERWYDATLTIDLAPHTGGRNPGDYYDVTIRWEYTVVPKHPQRRFACVADRDEYLELTADPGTSAWYLGQTNKLDPTDPTSYEVRRFSVNGEDRPIRRSTRKTGQLYTATIGTDVVEAGQPVTIAYTYRTVTARAGHVLFFDIEHPTRDLTIDFDYTNTPITTITTLDMVPSIRRTRIEITPPDHPTKRVHADLDGWVFPRSGIAFVWANEAGTHSFKHSQRPSRGR